MIAVNQDSLGKQAVQKQLDSNNVGIYQSLIKDDDGVGYIMAVLIVNWDDDNARSVDYDPVIMGLAHKPSNDCTFKPFGQDAREGDAKPISITNIEPHGYSAFKIKCDFE